MQQVLRHFLISSQFSIQTFFNSLRTEGKKIIQTFIFTCQISNRSQFHIYIADVFVAQGPHCNLSEEGAAAAYLCLSWNNCVFKATQKK